MTSNWNKNYSENTLCWLLVFFWENHPQETKLATSWNTGKNSSSGKFQDAEFQLHVLLYPEKTPKKTPRYIKAQRIVLFRNNYISFINTIITNLNNLFKWHAFWE